MPSGSTRSSWSNGKDICLPSRWCGFDSRWGLHAPVSQLEEDAGSDPVRSRFESGREYDAAWRRPSDRMWGIGGPPALGAGARGFDSLRPDCGRGRAVRRLIVDQVVAGANPVGHPRECGATAARLALNQQTRVRLPAFHPGRVAQPVGHHLVRVGGAGSTPVTFAQALIAQVDRATVYEAVRSRFESW